MKIILIACLVFVTPVFADDELGWHQECHVIDGVQQCAGHLEGVVRDAS